MELFAQISEVIDRTVERPALRPYQREALERVRDLYERGTSRTLLVAATGLGKTILFSFLPEFFPSLAKRGMLVLVHRQELAQQAAEKLQWVWPRKKVQIEMGWNRADEYDADYVVASVQTLGHARSTRLERFKNRFGIIVIDEAHHCSPGSQYAKILNFFGVGPEVRFPLPDGSERVVVGVTATPNRNDRQGLHTFFDDIAVDYNIRWGVENGYLVDIRAARINTGTDISKVSTRQGDFALGELEAAVNTHERNECIVKGFQEEGGQKAIAFCTGVKQAHDLAEEFRHFGVEAHAIDGEMDDKERRYLVERFRESDFPVLTNCQVATEGFDVPDVDTILMARPTKSTPLYIQCIGRGTRPVINPMQETAAERVQAIRDSAKPHMTIVDFTDNTGKHQIVTAPKLFGLQEGFEMKGRAIFDLVQEIEALEEAHPEKPIRMAKSLEEVHIIAQRLSVWDVADTPQEMRSFTDLMWMNTRDGVYQLHVPGSKDAPPDGRQNVVYRLDSDELGRFSVTRIKQPLYENGEMIRPKSEVTSGIKYPSLEEAIDRTDALIQRDHTDMLALIRNGMAWHDQPASESQVKYLARLGVYIPDGYELSKGKASRLISAAKSRL